MQETFWRPRNVFLIFGFMLSLAGAALWAAPVGAQGAPPVAPIVYAGSVTVGGQRPQPDGLRAGRARRGPMRRQLCPDPWGASTSSSR